VLQKAHKIFVRKFERKRSHGRPRHRWEGNIKLDLGEIDYTTVQWQAPVNIPGLFKKFRNYLFIIFSDMPVTE
jgi:hypothetical protein